MHRSTQSSHFDGRYASVKRSSSQRQTPAATTWVSLRTTAWATVARIAAGAHRSSASVGPSAITATVDRLVERGYVRHEEDVHDRRISWTRPTPAALTLFRQVNTGHDEQLHQILGLMPPDELEIVERALLVLRDAGARWVAEQSGDAGRVGPDAEACPPVAAGEAADPGPPHRPSRPRGADPA